MPIGARLLSNGDHDVGGDNIRRKMCEKPLICVGSTMKFPSASSSLMVWMRLLFRISFVAMSCLVLAAVPVVLCCCCCCCRRRRCYLLIRQEVV